MTKTKAAQKKPTTRSRVLGSVPTVKSSAPPSPLTVGTAVMIRCVTMYYTGRIVALDDREVLLTDAAWIADTGRFGEALATGKLNEVEVYPGTVSVARGSILDVTEWRHDLPRTTR